MATEVQVPTEVPTCGVKSGGSIDLPMPPPLSPAGGRYWCELTHITPLAISLLFVSTPVGYTPLFHRHPPLDDTTLFCASGVCCSRLRCGPAG
jgi:hypothetical protein